MKVRYLKSDELRHHGVEGQKWGIRRYQNPDGTLTAEGKRRYGTIEGFNKAYTKKQAQKKAFTSLGAGLGIAAGIAGGTGLAIKKMNTQAANWEGNGAMVNKYLRKAENIRTVRDIAAGGALIVSTIIAPIASGAGPELKRSANVIRGKEYSKYALKQIEKERINNAINKIENIQTDHELEELNKKK